MVQDVHMKCIAFYSNTIHGMRGTGMTTKHITVVVLSAVCDLHFADVE